MKILLLAIFSIVSFHVQAQDTTNVKSIWNEGSEWDVYYTVESDSATSGEDSIRATYCLRHADNNYMALEKTLYINNVKVDSQLQGYIRNDYDTVIYVRPVLENGSIGDECLLYDFREPYEYGSTIRYGVIGGEVKEEFIDWNKDSLDYYMLKNGDTHCLPSWKGIVYKYGYIGGPMDLFLMEAVPGRTKRPKPSNISHVIFTSKGKHKIIHKNGDTSDSDVIIPYDEMLTIGTIWECLSISTDQPDNRHTYTIHVKGDTLINKHRCKQIYSPEYNIQMNMYEEGRKVYVINTDDEPKLFLDFGLQEGDMLNEVIVVASIDIRENPGNDYKIFTIDSGLDCQSYFAGDTEPWNYYLIEGIGVSKDQYLREQLFVNAENTFSYLLRCWKDGILVYQTPGYETTSINKIHTTNNPVLYDITGRRLNTIPQKGIYIKGNKKIIIK